MKKQIIGLLISTVLVVAPVFAETYNLTIKRKLVNISGKPVKKITVNGTIPGPTLRFVEGEDVVINVSNQMDEDTSVHWHGLLLPGEMDGVPGLNGFPGIKPGETFIYRFKIRQSGTYWYHAHSLGQEQDGHYGSIVISPKGEDPIKSDRDYVILLSDFAEENHDEILANLKMHSAYYNYSQRTIADFFDDVKTKGFWQAWRFVKDWGQMRMSPTDLSDVSGYTFLVNGKTTEQNWTGLFKPGEKVRLRFINASAMSIYDVRIPGLQMRVVQADGQNVEPLLVDEFRFGVAETYDVLVEPKEEKTYTIVAEPIDRTGFATATLSPKPGMRGELPKHRPRTLLTMADMGMAHDTHMGHEMNHGMSETSMNSGWADAATPVGHKALDYKDLRYLGRQANIAEPEREVELRLGGNMERYIWTLNGKRHQESAPINLRYGERVRLKFTNETMMAHPMHLHGMFVQLENGQPAEKLPNKHTIIVPPGQSYSVLLTADEPGEWAFHCHLLYHMLSGMMTTVVVAKPDGHAEGEHPSFFHAFNLEADAGKNRDDQLTTWDLDGWLGGDYHKLWLRSEGEIVDSETHEAEFWALYSRNIAEFWDAQVGVRHDTKPASTSYLTLGVQGLAVYFFETEAHLFVSDEGDMSARIRQENDLLITQRLILAPYIEFDIFAQDVAEQEIGAGLANAELGLQMRYEITRKFAPYFDLRYERKFAETADIARSIGERTEDFVASLGVKLLF